MPTKPNKLRLEHFPSDRVPNLDDPGLIGQPRRTYLIRQLHTLLANPTGPAAWPAPPPPGADLEDSCAYWETALYLMVYLLGWRRPAAGLVWFYEREMADDGDRLLRALRQVWNSDGQLDLLTAWVCSEYGEQFSFYGHELPDGELPAKRIVRVRMSQSWLQALPSRLDRLVARHPHNPYVGGTNPLHLGHATQASWTGAVKSTLCTNMQNRKATLLLKEAPGWYASLAHAANHLPLGGAKPWRVDVTVKPAGWLGTFTRSPTSGRWHMTSEEIHLAGV